MALVRWEPLREMQQMRRRLEHEFERLMPRVTWAPALPEGAEEMFLPEVDIEQTADEIVMSADLPGMKVEDVSVEVAEDSITVAGTRKREKEVKEEGYYLSEREFGQFARRVQLPAKVKDQEAKAPFKDGVLTIHAPLAEEARRAKAHKIPIEAK